MSICRLNITIGIFDKEASNFIVHEKRVEGTFGRLFDVFLAGTKEERRSFENFKLKLIKNTFKNLKLFSLDRCNFKLVNFLGSRLANGSYWGAKGLLKENKIHLYSKWQSYALGEEFIDFSPACLSEATLLGEFADLSQKPNVNSLAFLQHSHVILQVILVGLLSVAFSVFCLQNFERMTKRSLPKWHPLWHLHSLSKFFFSRDRLLTKLNLVFIFFLIFLYINLNMLVSNIKTNSLVIDTGDLIDTPSKLQATKRFGCFFENSDIYFKNSKFGRGRHLRSGPDGRMCLLDYILSDFDLLKNFDPTRAFYVTEELPMYFILSIFSRRVPKKMIFIADKLFDHETVQTNFIAKALEPSLKRSLLSK